MTRKNGPLTDDWGYWLANVTVGHREKLVYVTNMARQRATIYGQTVNSGASVGPVRGSLVIKVAD